MSNRERAERFTHYVGMELKGRITAHEWTAQRLAAAMGRSPSALNGWLNGKRELPLSVLCEAAENLGVEPSSIVEVAYNRMVVALGELDGTQYDDEDRAYAESSRLSLVPTEDDQRRAREQRRANVTPLSEDELRTVNLRDLQSGYATAAGDDETTDTEDDSTP
jgi:transcriptional regulator with XRE-family HTH domain